MAAGTTRGITATARGGHTLATTIAPIGAGAGEAITQASIRLGTILGSMVIMVAIGAVTTADTGAALGVTTITIPLITSGLCAIMRTDARASIALPTVAAAGRAVAATIVRAAAVRTMDSEAPIRPIALQPRR